MRSPETCLASDLKFDALDRLTLTCAVEERFNVEFSDKQVEAFRTPEEIACAVSQILGPEYAGVSQ